MRRSSRFESLLRMDADWRDPNPGRGRVTAQQHALQAGTRAWELHNSDKEFIVAALLHDAARPFSDVHHGEVIAWMLKDRIRDTLYQALYFHGEFQHALLNNLPMPYKDREFYDDAMNLAVIDYCSFDPKASTRPFTDFRTILQEVLD